MIFESSDMLRVHHFEPEVAEVLGVGLRSVVWVQGCSRSCPGCIAPEMWPADKGDLVSVDVLGRGLHARFGVRGLTVSGGEPFEQPGALGRLLEIVSAEGLDTWVYTGYAFEELVSMASEPVDQALAMIDVLVDGGYEELRNRGESLRGSANQRILFLRGRIDRSEIDLARSGSRFEIRIDAGGGLVLVGIPPPGLGSELAGRLPAEGVRLQPHDQAWWSTGRR